MGYTHYWDHVDFTDKQWAKIQVKAIKILEAAKASGLVLVWEDDRPSWPAEVSIACIRFNGLDDDGHETFMLERMATDFTFCKTARKPYDAAVVAMLIMVAEVSKRFSWSSDGSIEPEFKADGEALLKLAGV